MSIEAIQHVSITVTDLARAKKFYGEVLGLEEMERPKSFDFPGAWYRAGTVLIHLIGRPQADPPGEHHFCLWVEDVHGAAEVIAAAGHPVTWERRKIPGIDRFFTCDCDGNRIEFQGPDGKLYPA